MHRAGHGSAGRCASGGARRLVPAASGPDRGGAGRCGAWPLLAVRLSATLTRRRPSRPVEPGDTGAGSSERVQRWGRAAPAASTARGASLEGSVGGARYAVSAESVGSQRWSARARDAAFETRL